MDVLKNQTSKKSRSSAETRNQINEMVEKLADQMKKIFDDMVQNGVHLSQKPVYFPRKHRHETTPPTESPVQHEHQHRHLESCKSCKSPSLSITATSPHKMEVLRSSDSQKHGKLRKKHNYSVCVEGLGDADGIILCVDLSLKNIPQSAKVLLGVSLVDELGSSSNCLQIQTDGTCKEYLPWNNSILISNLTADTLYGVVICAILDPRNRTMPPIIKTPRYRRIRTDSVEIHSSNYRTASVWRGVALPIVGGVSIVLLFLAVVIGFCVWSCRQHAELTRKKLFIFEAKRQCDERYTELPKKVDVWELERRNLIIYDDKRLGSGAFGTVFLGRLIGLAKGSKDAQSALGANLMRADNCDVAVKMLPEYADGLSKSEFLREIALMKSLGYHERLVNMLACVTNSEPYCLVVEYCTDGDLLHFLRQRCEYMLKLDENGVDYSDSTTATDEFDTDMIMTMRHLLQFAVQISYGLEYLSQKGYVHRDVAARNILVHDRQYAKIGDFGLCRYVYAQTSNYKGKGGRLPVKWMSPEAIRDYEFTTMSDVWSFGVLMFEIITLGGTPYPGVQPNDILEYLESGKRLAKPDNCPDDIYQIMSLCWVSQPSKRPEFAAIRRWLALQLEATTDEYSYLRLDAQKDYYNVAKEEKLQQAGADVSDMSSTDVDVSSRL